MKVLLVAINARYSHTALAVRYIAGCIGRGGACNVAIGEYTINQPVDDILERIMREKADVVAFSCYIWNVRLVCALAAELRKLAPQLVIAVGGPQAAAQPERFCSENPAVDTVLAGEGETVCPAYLAAVQGALAGHAHAGAVPRGVFGPNEAGWLNMDTLPFPYEGLDGLKERILYYESMRGCPFSCSYCQSANGEAVRYKSLEKVRQELDIFLQAGVRRVKFVDRTFNCNPKRALAIWRYLAERDNGFTNFHFELAGHLLDEESISFLAGVREGLFQFEIGVQSCCDDTLLAVKRPGNKHLLDKQVRLLRGSTSVHIHLDLIAGLPWEGYDAFGESFDQVYGLRPHQLQLGFLKVLGGSAMQHNAQQYGLVWRNYAPFEVLQTRWISYEELCRLKAVAHVVEVYYNSGRYGYCVRALEARWQRPFGFYEALAEFYAQNGGFEQPFSKVGYYNLLGAFAAANGGADERLQWLCRLDMALHEKPRIAPGWVRVSGSTPNHRRILDFYADGPAMARLLPQYAGMEPKQVLKQAHVEVLPFDPDTGEAGECALLMDYTRRDVYGRALCTRIELKG